MGALSGELDMGCDPVARRGRGRGLPEGLSVHSPRIPKRIIQTGKTSPAHLSLASRAGVVNATLLHPDYEYVFFDDVAITDFIKYEFPEYVSTFGRFQFPIQRI